MTLFQPCPKCGAPLVACNLGCRPGPHCECPNCCTTFDSHTPAEQRKPTGEEIGLAVDELEYQARSGTLERGPALEHVAAWLRAQGLSD